MQNIMIRIGQIFLFLFPYFSLAFLSGLLSILLLRSKGSSQDSQRKFLLWYIVGSFSLFLLGFLFIPFFEYISAFLIAPLMFVTGYVLAQRGDFPRLTITSMIIGAIWALISFAPYFLMVGGYVELPVSWRILTLPVWSSMKFENFVHHASLPLLLKSEPIYVDIFYHNMFFPIVTFTLPFLIGGFIGFLVFRVYSYLFVGTRRKPNQTLT